jgi:hypothetical protein
MIATPTLTQPVRYSVPTLTTVSIATTPQILSLSSQTFTSHDHSNRLWEDPVFSSSKVLWSLFRSDASFSAFLQDLLTLMLPDEDSPEDLPATSYAVSTALYLTPQARLSLGHRWTRPHVANDSYGGLRMSWVKGDREVRAIVPADSAPGTRKRYIYWDAGNKYGSVPSFTPSSLAAWLAWL